MVPFHGTPIGGSRQDVARFLVGRHALVPHFRRDDLGIVAEVCKSFVFDNSAYSVANSGGQLDVAGYTSWVEEWARHPGFAWALIPDAILGSEADNDALLRDWPFRLQRVGVPVWHLHESLSRLVKLCGAWPTVALGSSGQWRTPGTAAWWQRMAQAMDAICDSQGRPMARLHGLRMLDPRIFSRLPLASADSTNAAVNCGASDRFGMYRPATSAQRAAVNCGASDRFGMYRPATSAQRAAVIADRIENENSAAVWTRQPIQEALLA